MIAALSLGFYNIALLYVEWAISQETKLWSRFMSQAVVSCSQPFYKHDHFWQLIRNVCTFITKSIIYLCTNVWVHVHTLRAQSCTMMIMLK